MRDVLGVVVGRPAQYPLRDVAAVPSRLLRRNSITTPRACSRHLLRECVPDAGEILGLPAMVVIVVLNFGERYTQSASQGRPA